MFEIRKPIIFILSLVCACSISVEAAIGQASSTAVPAVVHGKEILVVHGPSGIHSAEKRVGELTTALDSLVEDPSFRPSSLSVRNEGSSSAIVYGDKVLITVTAEDSKAENLPQDVLAQNWLSGIKGVVESEKYRRNLHEAINQVKPGALKDNIIYILANPLSLKIGISVIGLFVLILVTYSIRRSIPRYFHESYKRYTVSKITEFSAYFLGLVYLSVVFSDTLGSLAVILGAATAGIALALKELIVSMAGWLAITFGDTYRVGDRVQISGVKGDVIDVGLVRTTLMELGEWVQGDLYTGRIVRVANGNVFAGASYNYSRDLPFLWDELVVKVSSDSEVEHARSIIQSVVDEVTGEFVAEAKLGWERLKEKYLVEEEAIDPTVTLAIQDSKIEFTVRYPVDYRQRRATKDKIYTRIIKQFGDSNGLIELPS
jgi:small-conductance mechanosensitive channel